MSSNTQPGDLPENSRALIIGGSSGIGRATAVALALGGFRVSVTYRHNRDEAESLLREGVAQSIHQLDLSDPLALEEWVNGPGASVLDVDVLVVNAGEILRPSGWHEVSARHIVETFSVHAIAPVLLARGAAAFMATRKSGRIVFTSSTYGLNGAGGVLAYGAAKASLVSTTRALAHDLGPQGVTVNCVAPGNIDTAMTRSAAPGVVDWVIETTPMGRLGRPEEVAAQTLFFVQNSFITGQVAIVDGGQELNM